jgi:predicted MFS family arabinose efflux permease
VFALSNLGMLGAASPLAWASARFGWRWAFVAAAAITAVVGAAFYLAVRDGPPGAPAPARRERLGEVLRGLALVWRTPGLAPVLAMHAFAYASMLTVLGLWAGPYLHDVYGLDAVARGHVLTVMSLAQIAGILAYGPLDRALDTRKWIVVPGAAGTIALLTLLAALPRPSVTVAAALLVLLCLVTAYGIVIVAHGRSLFPDHLAGRGVTTVNLAQVAGTSLLPILTGAVMSAVEGWTGGARTLAYRAMFASIALCLLAGLAVYVRAPDARPSARRVAAEA